MRRTFVALVGALALLATACGGSDSTEAAVPEPAGTEEQASEPAPEPTPEPEPTATAEPEPEPDPTATPEPEPEPEPTATPEPEPEPEPEVGRDFSAVDEAIEAFVADNELNGAGLIVVHRDEGVLHHAHFGEFDEDRISLIASSSKMISAGVLLALQDQGLLDIDAPIADIVDYDVDDPTMTPAQLVSNSSGLVGLGPDPLYSPYLCQWLAAGTLSGCGESVLTSNGDDDDIIAPDTEFRYGGAQWQVAGAVAEAASGKPWAQLIDEIYVQPCGLEALGYINLGALPDLSLGGYPASFGGSPDEWETENPNIEGGAYSTTGDYAELLLMHLREGRCGDNQVLSAEAVERVHADQIAAAYNGSAGEGTGYGMGWWIDRESGVISDGGAFGSFPWLVLEDGYGAYFVIEDGFETTGMFSDELVELVAEAVVG